MYKGEIATFPVEVVEKMLDYQEKQGNRRSVSIFEIDKRAGWEGFTWDGTPDGHHFWEQIICSEQFHLFFEKYPKVTPTTQLTFNFKGKPTDLIISYGKMLQMMSIKNDYDESFSMECKVTFKTEHLPLVMQVVERMNLTIVNDSLTEL